MNKLKWILDGREPAYLYQKDGRWCAEIHWDAKFGMTEAIEIPYPHNLNRDRAKDYLEGLGYKVGYK